MTSAAAAGPWELWDQSGRQRAGLAEAAVRLLVRVNEDPDVHGRNPETDGRIMWSDVQNDPLPPELGDEAHARGRTPPRTRPA